MTDYTLSLSDMPVLVRITSYRPAQRATGTYGERSGRFSPPDPEELEFSVFLPCGCRLEPDDEQAQEIEEQLQQIREKAHEPAY